MRQSLRRHRQLSPASPATPSQYSNPHADSPSLHLNSVQNYFTILHHLYGRKHQKHLLKIESPQSMQERNQFALSERITKMQDNGNGKLLSKNKKKYSQQLLVGESHRQNWKNSILRRKNNGSHGQIIRGFAHNRHHSVMEKVQPQLGEIKNSLKVKADKQIFIPLGAIHQERQRASHYDELNIKRKIKGQSNISELRRTRKFRSEADEMARTYAHGRLSTDHNFIRRVNLNSPARKEKLLSPWEVITQR